MEKYTLKFPVQFGKGELVEELTLKPSARAFKGFSITAGENGSSFDPYAAALVAVRMAGRPEAFAAELHPDDMMALAKVAMRFFSDGLADGSEPSE